MQRFFQTIKLSLAAPARRWARVTFVLTAAVICAAGWYAWSTGQTIAWILLAGLLALLLTFFFLRSKLASRLLKEMGKRTVHSQTRAVRSALQNGFQQGEHLVEKQGKAVEVELKKLAAQAAKELDLAAGGLKRDIASSPARPMAPFSKASGPVCSACGQILRSTSKFCDHCGEPLTRHCPRCGRPARSAVSRFCGECGVSLEV
jgi:predicted amidophosphoribosyltransferase